MTEPTATVPAEQVQTPPQQTPADPATTAPQENWKARYDGLVLKVQELTLANQNTFCSACAEVLRIGATERATGHQGHGEAGRCR